MKIIAEVKTMSPFGYLASKTWDELFRIAESAGDVISVHTDPRWGGSYELVKRACDMTRKPVLAKGIHQTDAEVERLLSLRVEVLVVGRLPHTDLLRRCWIEPLSLEQLKMFPPDIKAVWNSRDISTGRLKSEMFQEAREVFPGWLCQASNIRTMADVKEGADAVLVGTHLEEFVKSLHRPPIGPVEFWPFSHTPDEMRKIWNERFPLPRRDN